ncbi:MAG: ABC transporter permease [Clostridia bacterium]
MVEFYTLIAMTCLYGGILGTVAINQNLANMSANGKRVSVSPVSKSKMIFSSVLASYITQLIGLALLFVYTIFVLKINYGNNFLLILLLSLCGCLAGLTLGVAIGSILKSSDNVKTGVVISITMLGCFLSGMMGITMKYVIRICQF